MELYNIDVLAELNRERLAELVRDAQMNRLLKSQATQPVNGVQPSKGAEEKHEPAGLLAAVLALPARFKLA
jgi:hypothetical protein